MRKSRGRLEKAIEGVCVSIQDLGAAQHPWTGTTPEELWYLRPMSGLQLGTFTPTDATEVAPGAANTCRVMHL